MRDIIIFLGDFSFFLLFSIGCESEFRKKVAYLEVWSSDLKPIHEKIIFHEISDIFMGNLGYIHSDIVMGILGYIHEHSRIYSWAFSDIFMGKI